MPTPAQARDLHDLRQAAQTRDQQAIQYLLKRLLAELDYFPALAIVAERLYAWLDIFESYTADYAWLRAALLTMANYGHAPDEGMLSQALHQPPSEAGLANFLKAFHDLGQAMQAKHTASARVGFLASALVNVTMAELAEAWYGERPQVWEQVRSLRFEADGTPSDPEAAQWAYAFWTDEETAALERQCWHEVAERIEAALSRQTG